MKPRLIASLMIVFFLAGNMEGYGFRLGEVSVPLRGRSDSKAVTQGLSSQTSWVSTCTVTNIIIKSIDNYFIYAKDGRSFSIDSSVTIVNNHNPDVKVQIGELFFKDGKLVAVIIK